jgi:hypothetical protein
MPARSRTPAATLQEAEALEHAVHARGDYAHVSVRVHRDHLLICNDGDPVARLTPLGGGQFGLAFQTHSRQWEPMPFVGTLAEQAQNLLDALGMYLERYDFSPGKSGSGH